LGNGKGIKFHGLLVEQSNGEKKTVLLEFPLPKKGKLNFDRPKYVFEQFVFWFMANYPEQVDWPLLVLLAGKYDDGIAQEYLKSIRSDKNADK
jgi:hypothetical protein